MLIVIYKVNRWPPGVLLAGGVLLSQPFAPPSLVLSPTSASSAKGPLSASWQPVKHPFCSFRLDLFKGASPWLFIICFSCRIVHQLLAVDRSSDQEQMFGDGFVTWSDSFCSFKNIYLVAGRFCLDTRAGTASPSCVNSFVNILPSSPSARSSNFFCFFDLGHRSFWSSAFYHI